MVLIRIAVSVLLDLVAMVVIGSLQAAYAAPPMYVVTVLRSVER